MSNTDPREQSLAKPRPPQGPSDEQVLASFDHHAPDANQVERIEAVRRACKSAAAVGLACCPASADRTAGLRLIHEGMMTLNKSIVLEPGTPSTPSRAER